MKVQFINPTEVGMGSPRIGPVRIEGLDWKPPLLEASEFYENISAVAEGQIVLARWQLPSDRVNFVLYWLDTYKKQVWKSDLISDEPSSIQIIGPQFVRVQLARHIVPPQAVDIQCHLPG